MKKRLRSFLLSKFKNVYRTETHSQGIERILNSHSNLTDSPVFIEIGCGETTLLLAEMGKKFNAKIFSLDIDEDKINKLKDLHGDLISNVNFLIGDSLDTLQKIIKQHNKIDFVFLDSSASAIQTFKEFKILEDYLSPHAQILIDNASIPGKRLLLSPVRKGKILVPYLLSSDNWKVLSLSRSGDSMVAAVHNPEGGFADISYEL